MQQTSDTENAKMGELQTALIVQSHDTSMGSWKNEDDIKAELRILTDELKSLRQELSDLVAPPKQNPTRAFLHRQAWPPPSSRRTEVVEKAAERPRPKVKGRRRTDSSK